jgi:putative hydrolase of the HAD superfamily
LVFPDHSFLRQAALCRGYDLALPRWERVACEFGQFYDEAIRSGQDHWGVDYFVAWMLERLGVAEEDISPLAAEALASDRERSLWRYVYPWLRGTLQRLASRGYRMSVISNADGRVKQGFQELGLAGYFEEIFDSHLVGYQKPDRRLFQHAMGAFGLQPSECLYVGDLYYVDVLGANRAGVAAIHLDPYGLYEDLPGVHIPSVAALPGFLEQGLDLRGEEFLPLRE